MSKCVDDKIISRYKFTKLQANNLFLVSCLFCQPTQEIDGQAS